MPSDTYSERNSAPFQPGDRIRRIVSSAPWPAGMAGYEATIAKVLPRCGTVIDRDGNFHRVEYIMRIME